MSRDDHAAGSGRVCGGHEVFGAEACGGAGGAEGRGIGVGADAADVNDGVGGQDVLGQGDGLARVEQGKSRGGGPAGCR